MIVAQQCVPLQPDALRQQLEAWQARWPSLGVMALVPDESGAFTTTQVELTTIGNMTTLSGDVIQFIGGSKWSRNCRVC